MRLHHSCVGLLEGSMQASLEKFHTFHHCRSLKPFPSEGVGRRPLVPETLRRENSGGY